MRYPPQTEDFEKLSRFFDRTDTTELAELEEVSDRPERPGVRGRGTGASG